MNCATGIRTDEFLRALTDRIIAGGVIAADDAQRIMQLHTHEEVIMLICHATRLRTYFKGAHIELCSIVNAKSGRCTEDCIFCAQSVHHSAEITAYPLLETAKVIQQAREAEAAGAARFSIVTSGKGIQSEKELMSVCASIATIREETGLATCASLGLLADDRMQRLRNAGLMRYHHNLETAGSYFPKICTTHSYQERVDTIRAAKKAGLEVCAGGIFGLGETPRHCIELALTLKALDVDSIPLNFLIPIRGTPAERYSLIAPLEMLKIIALFRFMLPAKDIRVCGGRETGLRTLQPLMYLAGANATMTGNYLTTSGRNSDIDLQEIKDLALEVSARTGVWKSGFQTAPVRCKEGRGGRAGES